MPPAQIHDPWTEFLGGFRGSSLLRGGAVLIFLAALLNFFSYLVPANAGQSTLVISGWTIWILGLWLLAGGFIWVGTQPTLSRMGIVVGIFFLLNGLLLLVVLFLDMVPIIPPTSLSLGRALILLVFAVFEKKRLGTGVLFLLILTASLFTGKITLRLLGVIPPLGVPVDPALDALLVILMAVALFSLGTAVRRGENAWAREVGRKRPAALADFNNPEHEWNRKTK